MPFYISSDSAIKQISIGWITPSYDGGCSLLGYELYRNDGGATEVDIQVISMADDNPSLTSHTIDMSFGTVGAVYGFKLKARNYAGDVETSALNVALASLPSKPDNPPASNASITRQDRLGI